jgi:hypothetical protein
MRTKRIRGRHQIDAAARARAAEIASVEAQRPKTRADCVDGPRPCPWVGCRYHLRTPLRFEPATDGSGRVHVRFMAAQAEDLSWLDDGDAPTCALDIAETVALSGEVASRKLLARLLGATRQAIQQQLIGATMSALASAHRLGLTALDVRPDINDIITRKA